MADIVLEETLLRQPNLWAPGKMPLGRLKLDMEHPISEQVMFCLFPAGNGFHDLKNGYEFTPTNVNITRKGAEFTSTTSRLVRSLSGHDDWIASFTSSFTIMFLIQGKPGGADAYWRFANITPTAARQFEIWFHNTGDYLTYRRDGGTGTFNWTPGGWDSEARMNMIFATDFSNAWNYMYHRNMWTNDRSFRSDQTSIGPAGTLDGGDNIIIGNRTTFDRGFDGVMELIVALDSRYTDIYSLLEDPYQFLMPA